MILLDTGRLMSPKIGSYRKLDYAINASVHLAQIALHKGDLVGYAIFNDELRAFAEPKKGQAQMSHLVRNLTSLQATRLESDYAAVFHHVLRRCSRRTLIVCFTDLGDAHSAESLLQAALPLRAAPSAGHRHGEQFRDSGRDAKDAGKRIRGLPACRRDGNLERLSAHVARPAQPRRRHGQRARTGTEHGGDQRVSADQGDRATLDMGIAEI